MKNIILIPIVLLMCSCHEKNPKHYLQRVAPDRCSECLDTTNLTLTTETIPQGYRYTHIYPWGFIVYNIELHKRATYEEGSKKELFFIHTLSIQVESKNYKVDQYDTGVGDGNTNYYWNNDLGVFFYSNLRLVELLYFSFE